MEKLANVCGGSLLRFNCPATRQMSWHTSSNGTQTRHILPSFFPSSIPHVSFFFFTILLKCRLCRWPSEMLQPQMVDCCNENRVKFFSAPGPQIPHILCCFSPHSVAVISPLLSQLFSLQLVKYFCLPFLIVFHTCTTWSAARLNKHWPITILCVDQTDDVTVWFIKSFWQLEILARLDTGWANASPGHRMQMSDNFGVELS